MSFRTWHKRSGDSRRLGSDTPTDTLHIRRRFSSHPENRVETGPHVKIEGNRVPTPWLTHTGTRYLDLWAFRPVTDTRLSGTTTNYLRPVLRFEQTSSSTQGETETGVFGTAYRGGIGAHPVSNTTMTFLLRHLLVRSRSSSPATSWRTTTRPRYSGVYCDSVETCVR